MYDEPVWEAADDRGGSGTTTERAQDRARRRGRPVSTADVVRTYLAASYSYPAPDVTTATYTEPRRWLRTYIGGPEWAEHRTLVKAWARAEGKTGPPFREWCRNHGRKSVSTALRRVDEAVERIAAAWDAERAGKSS